MPAVAITDLVTAKAIRAPVVYGLCHGNLDGLFYIGSTTNPRKRFQAYASCRAHGNAELAKKLAVPLTVVVFDTGDEDIRAAEFALIRQYAAQLVNIIKEPKQAFGRAKGVSASGQFLKAYRNRFSGLGAMAFMAEIRSALRLMTPFERKAAEARFALIIAPEFAKA